MSTAHTNPPPQTPDAADRRSRTRMYAAIAIMLALFALVVTFRRDIRVRWWEHRLYHAHHVPDQARFVDLLATEPTRVAPVARRLLAHHDPILRSYGVMLAARAPATHALELLQQALQDLEPAVRYGAIQSLAARPTPEAIATLRDLADHPDQDTAMRAVHTLGNIPNPSAANPSAASPPTPNPPAPTSSIADALCQLARTHARTAIRAEAITALAHWESPQVVATLKECLRDESIHDGPLAAEQIALESLQQATPHLANAAELPHDQHHTNAQRAAAILESWEN